MTNIPKICNYETPLYKNRNLDPCLTTQEYVPINTQEYHLKMNITLQ